MKFPEISGVLLLINKNKKIANIFYFIILFVLCIPNDRMLKFPDANQTLEALKTSQFELIHPLPKNKSVFVIMCYNVRICANNTHHITVSQLYVPSSSIFFVDRVSWEIMYRKISEYRVLTLIQSIIIDNSVRCHVERCSKL